MISLEKMKIQLSPGSPLYWGLEVCKLLLIKSFFFFLLASSFNAILVNYTTQSKLENGYTKTEYSMFSLFTHTAFNGVSELFCLQEKKLNQ